MTSSRKRTKNDFAARGPPEESGGILRKLHSGVAASAVLVVTASTAALAQTVPPPVTPQQVAPTREEIDRRPQQVAPRAGKLTIDGGIERAPCALDAPQYADIRVTISEAQFNNLQGVSPEELKTSYAQLLGADRPISTICTIRDAAATLLRKKGYLAAVQVPVQRIENGVVRFEVLYAKIVAVRVRGEAGKAEGLLAGYLSHLNNGKVFNRLEAERYLLLARDLPGYNVRLALKPAGTVPGELVGEVSVERQPLDITASLQNFSSRSTGRWTGALVAQTYGLFGGDRLTASVASTADFKEQQTVQLGYDTRVGNEGLILSGNFTYVWTEPDVGSGAKLEARTLFATGEVGYPIIRTQGFSLLSSVGLDYLDQKVDGFGGQLRTRDHLRVGFLRLDMDAADISERRVPNWRASGSVELRHGLDIFGASSRVPIVTGQSAPLGSPSRTYADPTATVIRASAQIELHLGGNYWAVVLPRAQYGFSSLFSFEQFSGGNYSIGRGYDPGVISGDKGIGSAFELRFPRIAPLDKVNLTLQPFAFFDVAWVGSHRANRVRSAINVPNGISDEVVSAGAGVRGVLNNRFRIDGTVAVPLKTAGLTNRIEQLNGRPTNRQDVRFLVTLTGKLWPWGGR